MYGLVCDDCVGPGLLRTRGRRKGPQILVPRATSIIHPQRSFILLSSSLSFKAAAEFSSRTSNTSVLAR